MEPMGDCSIFERSRVFAKRSFQSWPNLFSAVRVISSKWVKSSSLGLIAGFAMVLPWQMLRAQVGEPVIEIVTRDKVLSVPTTSLSSLPLQIYTSVAEGYDDNFRATAKEEGSFFTSGRLSLSYALAREAIGLSIVAGGGAVIYPEQTDYDGFLNLTFNYAVSRRLSLNLELDGGYQAEPDFGSDVGPSARAGSFFHANDTLSATYELSRDWSSVSSYSFRLVRYDDTNTAAVTDRQEHTFGEQLRYQWSPTVLVVAEYRFETIDYVTAPRDSDTNFILGGLDAQLSRRLKVGFRSGATFRHMELSGDTTDPHFEGSLDYMAGRDATLRLTTSYSVEETGLQTAASRTTFRTGLQLIYGFTARIRSTLSFDYHHDENAQPNLIDGPSGDFSEDSLAVSAGLSYQINRRWTTNLNFDHSDVISDIPALAYSRNRGSIGFSFIY